MNLNKTSAHLEFVISAVTFIERNLQETVDVDRVCEFSPFSKWQSQRIFRALTGDSIANYIRTRKLTKSLELLNYAGARSSDVAEIFKFGSSAAFARSFKVRFGLTPVEFRGGAKISQRLLKPQLTDEKIRQIARGIEKSPSFQSLGKRSYRGLKLGIGSPFSECSTFNESLLGLWEKFNLRRHQLKSSLQKASFGLTAGSDQTIDTETLDYLAAAELSSLPKLEEFTDIEIQESKYAVFEVRGPVELCHIITDYVYGIWLPQSGFKRAEGYEIDLYDHRNFHMNRPESIAYRLVPIEE